MILLVAVVAVGAATGGPTYYSAARVSILRDTSLSGPVVGRGFEAVQSGAVSGLLGQLEGAVDSVMGPVQNLLQNPTEAIEATAFDTRTGLTVGMDWRTGVCAHLRLQGTCPQSVDQVIASRSLAATEGWRLGEHLTLNVWGSLVITGIYDPPSGTEDYWFDRAGFYFPYENPPSLGTRSTGANTTADALFTVKQTLDQAPSSVQGNAVVDDLIRVDRVQPADLSRLTTAFNSLTTSAALTSLEININTTVPSTVSAIKAGWSSLAVPVLIITLQLTGLSWLLLLLLVTEFTEGRGPEVALAKLRGRGRLRTVFFGVSEPVALIAVAFPAGALVGWAATAALGHARLRPGTPVGLPAWSWAAAAVATVGGVAAVAAASRRTLRRPVIEQWRRAARRATDRSWVIDAVLLTGAVAGLLELWFSGAITSAHRSSLSLLVPGLLGISVAVVASRLLPLACRAVMAGPRLGGLAGFLAVRHIARRPGGARTTIMLATSFALATFGVASFALDQLNYRSAAVATVGAPTVLDVTIPPGQPLGADVARADPSGRLATAVEFYGAGGGTTVAVDPSTFGRVALWPGGTPASVVRQLPALLDPPAPPALVLDGDAVRVHLRVRHTSTRVSATLDVVTTDGSGPTPVSLGNLPASGPVTLSGSLVSCPCRVQDLSFTPIAVPGSSISGTVLLSGVDMHGPAGWRSLGAAVDASSRWSGRGSSGSDPLVQSGPDLQWSFGSSNGTATLQSIDRPDPLPAVAGDAFTRHLGPAQATGLDGGDLPVRVVRTVPVIPSAPSGAVMVDQRYAEYAAANALASDVDQVWLAPGAARTVVPKLAAEGVSVVSTQTVSGEESSLDRQGPGLARILFLAEAAAAALLAVGGTVLGLYLSARRRRYELAALAASGVRRRTLLSAVAVEQLVVVTFGIVVGIGTGLVAAAVALGEIPEFEAPPGSPLASFPPAAPLVVAAVVSVAVVVMVALVASASLIRSLSAELLREGPA